MVRSSWREGRPAAAMAAKPVASGPRQVYVARQPVFDRRRHAVGYELLYRSGRGDEYDAANGSAATAQVIVNAFMTIGLDQLTGGRRAFIRFTRELLVSECATILPRDQVVIDVLKDIAPTPEVIGACKRLRADGFRISLDERALRDEAYRTLLPLADIVRVDFAAGEESDLRRLAGQPRPPGLALMAVKVETDEEFRLAVKWGYDYFQGYFLCRPTMIRGEDVPGYKNTYLRVLQEINQEALNFRQLAMIIKPELSLTYKLLRYVNSAAFGWRNRIETINHAMVALGEREFRKWVSLVCLTSMGEDRPRELLVQSVVRAWHCEAIARELELDRLGSDYFMVGLLSHLEAIVGQPLPLILQRISLHQEIVDALANSRGAMADALHSIVAFEASDADQLAELCRRLGLPLKTVSNCYHEAIRKANQVFAAGGEDEG